MSIKAIKNTAILVFANSSKKELVQKPSLKNSLLFDKLTQETLTKVKKTGLPYFHFTENEQSGDTFGERFVNAIQEIYDKGFDTIITVGNDSPQLKTQHLLEANAQLQLGKTVLGPTFDGGFYLMGLHHTNFNAALFKRLPWQRFSLFNTISKVLENSNSHLYKLPVLKDIDTKKDVVVLLNFSRSISKTVQFIFALIIKKTLGFFETVFIIYSESFSSSLFNKGSPYPQITA